MIGADVSLYTPDSQFELQVFTDRLNCKSSLWFQTQSCPLKAAAEAEERGTSRTSCHVAATPAINRPPLSGKHSLPWPFASQPETFQLQVAVMCSNGIQLFMRGSKACKVLGDGERPSRLGCVSYGKSIRGRCFCKLCRIAILATCAVHVATSSLSRKAKLP